MNGKKIEQIAADYLKTKLNHFKEKEGGHGKCRATQMGFFNTKKDGGTK